MTVPFFAAMESHPVVSASILHLEDSSLDAELVRTLLEKERLQIDIERVYDRATFIARLSSKPYDVILSDYEVPSFQGFDALELAQRMSPDTPFIFVSGMMGEDLAVESLKRGAADYVLKQRLNRLTAAVRRALTEMQARRERNRVEQACRTAEARVRQGDERLRMALAAARMATWQYEPSTNVLLTSDNAPQVFGLKPGELLTDTEQLFSLIHAEDVERHRVCLENAGRNGKPYFSLFRIIRPDNGAVQWMEERGHAIHDASGAMRLVGVVQDITGRKEAEGGRQRFAALAENSTDFIGMYDLNGTPLYINRAGLNMVGLAGIEQARTLPLSQFFFDDDQERVINEFLPAVLRDGRGEIEIRFRNFKTGEPHWMAFKLFMLTDASSGEGATLATVSQDITERRKLEQNLRKLADDLSDADRRKDEFLGVLSHELRTPLTAILGWIKLLMDKKVPADKMAYGLQVIERNVKAQAQLIEDLLDISRIVADKLALNCHTLDMCAIVETAIESVRPSLDARKLNVETRLRPVKLVGDQHRLQQVVWNLLTNAIKFTPQGGKIEVELDKVQNRVQLIVRDNGRGIEPEYLSTIFNRFQQGDEGTTRSFGGLGLGLTIARHIIERHNGTIRAESAGENQGSVFFVDLPLPVPALLGPVEARSNGAQLQSRNLAGIRILTVDDEADTREMLEMTLRMHGAQVITAGSASEAFEHFLHFRPDVLVSDIGMPVEDGCSLIRRIRKLAQDDGGNTTALALTAFAREEDQQRAFDAGFNAHAAKPIDPSRLISLVASIAGSRA